MKFRCERDVLERAFSVTRRATPGRGSALPVLTGLQLTLKKNRLVVVGSDLDLTVRAQVEVGGERDGTAVVPASLGAEIMRSLDSGQVQIEVNEEGFRVSSGRSDFSLKTLPADEFPNLEEPGGESVTLEVENFAAALEQVVKAASIDDSRPILTGVLLAAESEGLRLVATDSYRMAVRDLPGTEILGRDQTVLIPSRALDVVHRLLGNAEHLSIQLGERDAGFAVNDVRIITRLIEGEFPNYRGLIPDSHPNSLIVNREALLFAVQRVSLLAKDATPVRLVMTGDGLELIAISQDVGQAHESVDATYTGDDLTVAFNPEYLLDGLTVSPGDEVRLDTMDALKPAILRGVGDEDFLYLLMPVRVS